MSLIEANIKNALLVVMAINQYALTGLQKQGWGGGIGAVCVCVCGGGGLKAPRFLLNCIFYEFKKSILKVKNSPKLQKRGGILSRF